jgi:hypothetical protein
VQIGCNDLQGADLSRRLFARLGARTEPDRSGFDGYNVLIIYSHPRPVRILLRLWSNIQLYRRPLRQMSRLHR